MWKTFINSPSTVTLCLLQNITCVDWTIYSWQGSNSLGCPLVLRTNNRCVQSINISVDDAKCVEKLHKFSKYTHFLSVAKYYLCWLNNLFMARFQLIRMSSYAKNKVQMCSVSVDVAKCVENVYKFTQFTHFLSVTKKDLSWLNNLFMAKFQLNRMSTYVKNIL